MSSSNSPSAAPSFDDYFKAVEELKRVKEELHQTQRKVAVLDGQNLAMSLTLYHGFHGEKTSKDSVRWEVGRDYMEELYFRDRHVKKTWQSNPKKFSAKEWQRVKDHWVDVPDGSQTKGHPEDFDMSALDIMFYAIGVPVHVVFHRGFPRDFHQLHLRIPVGGQHGFMHQITLGRLKDLVWEKWGEAWLEENGWRRREMHFGHLNCGCLEDYDDREGFQSFEEEDDDDAIGHYFNDGSALEMRLIPSYYETTSEEETEESESEADESATSSASSAGEGFVKILMRHIGIPPERTIEQCFFHDITIREIKERVACCTPVDDLEVDDIRVQFQDSDLDDNKTLRECNVIEGSTITIIGRIRGGGGSKRKIEERQDETWRVATKAMKEVKPDNQFMVILQNLHQSVSNNVPIFENAIQQMQYEPSQHLQNAWFECPQTQAERVMEQIWHHIDASFKAIHKAEEDAKMAKKCIIPLLTFAYMKEFPDGVRGSCDHDAFETMLTDRVRDLEKELEVNRRVAEQLKKLQEAQMDADI